MGLLIRLAEPRDEARIREVAAASKGHWGYDTERVHAWASKLELVGEVDVAEAGGEVVAWSALLPGDGDVCVLEELWVDPPWIGKGVGTELFRRAAGRARAQGARALEWESEPNAVGFYEKMGGLPVRERLSSWGRVLTVMRIEL
ncbi:MAG TPA: GNAT family N-acetyltransferase [Gaiellaceae bacterium]